MSLIRPPSFFDSENLQKASFWEKPSKDQQHLDQIQPFLKGVFYKRSKKNGVTKKIYLYLDERYLYYLKDNYNIKGVTDMTTLKLELFVNVPPRSVDEKFNLQMNGFKFSKNQRGIDIFTPDDNLYKDWKKVLNYRTIQTTFHDEFMVTKMIGKGSFAKVYLATKKENNLQYAIKAFNKEFMLAQHKGKESLINEIVVMRALHNDHLIHLYEVYETQNSIYFVVDLLAGGELLHRVRGKEHFNERDLRIMTRNMLLALAHLHEKQIMHRDLKPENLLLKTKDNDYEVVVADFGLATFINQEHILFKRCGTPGFVAPEVLQFKEGDPLYGLKCDIFSVGVIFYLLLTGRQPFQGKDYKEILRANKACKIDFQQKELVNISKDALELLQAMLQPDPNNRPSALECLNFSFLKKDGISQQQLQSSINLRNYEVDFVYNVRNKVMDSQELTGSMQLQQGHNSGITGQTNTIGSLGCLSSSSLVDNQRNVPTPQQSKFAKQYSIDTKIQEEGLSPSAQSVDKKKSGKDFYKMAIQNNIYKQPNSQKEERKKDNESDQDIGQEDTGLSRTIDKMNFQNVLRHAPSKEDYK
ncbi:Protein kinase-like domain [Pseudocohnilembus persalinus]|uniref:Protein kinase-like domain n=1 Tax=Pseudocohnilembus persalinus TaxID=266149 RepID=A0A0V0R9Q7_PSEPJ|nr:Protein kinase-like domain [Pseudocohnilembus persalinus]|eukprot:KRX11222.1 Protein kinase-like domain [Pseudocohnilembus persalinus]